VGKSARAGDDPRVGWGQPLLAITGGHWSAEVHARVKDDGSPSVLVTTVRFERHERRERLSKPLLRAEQRRSSPGSGHTCPNADVSGALERAKESQQLCFTKTEGEPSSLTHTFT
jgi:hypothetical protein